MKKTSQPQQQPKQNLNLVEQISQRFTEKLLNTPFPVDRLSEHWKRAAFIALKKASPVSTGISHTDLAALYRMGAENLQLSFQQFATLSNNLDTKSADDLGMFGPIYADLLTESITHIDFFAEQAGTMRKDSEQEIAAETTDKPAGAFKPLIA